MQNSAAIAPDSGVNEVTINDPFSAVCDALKEKWNGKVPRPVIEWLLATRELTGVFRHASTGTTAGVFDGMLEALDIQYLTGDADLKRIPATGPAVLVANHPFGLLEGIVLGSLLARVRPDYRFLANSLLGALPEIERYVLPVDPYGDPRSIPQNGRSLRNAMRWLAKGGLLVVFPAGEVSSLQGLPPKIKDKDWNQRVLEVARRAGAAVIPAYFKGRNSFVFQCAGFTHPAVRTALLARELVNKRGKKVEIAIGTPVRPEKLLELSSEGEMTAYLRQRTYSLAHRPSSQNKNRIQLPFRLARHTAAIAPPVDTALLAKEIASLDPLYSRGEYRVYGAEARRIPNVLREIGRLREVTFRAVGEGTGRSIDIDRFDQHYLHLFLWNEAKQEIAGAYRVGDVDEILRRFGPAGLYSHTLFQFESGFLDKMRGSVELGRSFVREEYQRMPHSLSYLWKGIGAVIRQAGKRFLFGPVSISENYGAAARELLVAWFESQHRDSAVKPRRPFRRRRALDELARTVKSVRELSDLVSDLQSDGKPMPVLLRHYLNLGGRVLAFNVDPDFSNALDGLIVVDLEEAPPAMLERYIGSRRSDERPAA